MSNKKKIGKRIMKMLPDIEEFFTSVAVVHLAKKTRLFISTKEEETNIKDLRKYGLKKKEIDKVINVLINL